MWHGKHIDLHARSPAAQVLIRKHFLDSRIAANPSAVVPAPNDLVAAMRSTGIHGTAAVSDGTTSLCWGVGVLERGSSSAMGTSVASRLLLYATHGLAYTHVHTLHTRVSASTCTTLLDPW